MIDYQEATEYVLSRFGVCKGFNFRRLIILFLALFCYSFNIICWIYVSGNTLAIMINCLFLLSTFIGSFGVSICNYISLIIFTISTFLFGIGSIILVILLGTKTLNTESIGSNLSSSELITLYSLFAFFQSVLGVLLTNIVKNIKIYATSGSIYMNFVDDFDF